MPSNDDDPNGVEDSTKQVDRAELNAALNRSVDSQKILQRVNAEVQEEIHAEGTAQIDRDQVARYIEAARSGEFPAMEDNAPRLTGGPAEGRVPDSAELLAESSESVYESPERDTTGPKAAIFRRTPSKGVKAIPKNLKLPRPPKPIGTPADADSAAPDATELPESSPPLDDELSSLAANELDIPTELDESEAGSNEHGAVDFSAIQEALTAPKPSFAPAPELDAPAELTADALDEKKNSSPWMGVVLLAIVGTLLGAIVGAIVVFLK